MCIAYVLLFTPYSLATIMSFTQSNYSVKEGDRSAQLVLVLSNPSSTDITAHVISNSRLASGEYCSFLLYMLSM